MNNQQSNALNPFLVLTFIFFIIGLMTTINGQCQGPMKIAFLEQAGDLKNTLATLISFCFFTGFLINSIISSKWINCYGYKTPLLRGLVVMTIALLTYCLSSFVDERYSGAVLKLGDGNVPYAFFIFLLGSFLLGSSVALMQTVIIPYVSAYRLRNTSAVQRVNITCAANSLGTTIAPFFVIAAVFGGSSLANFGADKLMIPFLLMAIGIGAIRIIVGHLPLPDIKDTRIEQGEKGERNIWSFRHLRLGVIAIFFYVGAEMSVGMNINLFAMELEKTGEDLSFFGENSFIIAGLNLGIPALLATLYWGGMMVGRIASGMLNNISPRIQLTVTTIMGTILTLISILADNLWCLVSVGLLHSVMWGCIFTLAVKGLHKYTAKASGVFMMGVFGGAFFPVLQGYLADMLGSWRWTWMMVIVCELVMLYYAQFGSKIKAKDIIVETGN